MSARFLSILACALITCASIEVLADDASEIKKLIPTATAMSSKDFLAMATSPNAPQESDFKDKPLTLMLFSLQVTPEDTDEQKLEFQYLDEGGFIKPSALAEETYRGIKVGKLFIPSAPRTMVHANRITEFTYKVDGDKATGRFHFRVPKLYRGQVDYVAKRTDEKWQIVELQMPARGIDLVRNDDGKWSKK